MCSLSNSAVGGSLIVFDDYNTAYGTTVSLDNFESKHKLKIEKLFKLIIIIFLLSEDLKHI